MTINFRNILCGAGALLAASTIAGAAQADDTLVIGAAVGMTGWVAPYDSPVMDGLEVAIAEFKKAGGIDGKYNVQVITKDNRSDTAQNAIVTQELIEEGVDFLIVTCDSSMVHAVATMIQEAQIPTISSCSSSPTLPFTGGGFVFANAPADNVQATVSAAYSREQGFKRAYLLQSPDIEYTLMPVYFGEVFEKLGGTVVGTGNYEIGNQDFSAEVTKIAALDPPVDVIYTSAFEPDFPAFLRQLRSAGVKATLIAADGIDSPTTFGLGEVANGVIYTTAGMARPGNALEAFNKKFAKHFGRESETNIDALGYDLAKVLEAAIVKAGSIEPIAIRDAIFQLENIQGATSMITYKGTNGTPQRAVALVRVMNGKREFIAQPDPDMSLVPEPRL